MDFPGRRAIFILWLLVLPDTQAYTPVSVSTQIGEMEGKGSNAGILFIQQIFPGFCCVTGAMQGTADAKMNKNNPCPKQWGNQLNSPVAVPLAFQVWGSRGPVTT